MYDVVLSGYYGFGNSGDEALLKSIISDLKSVKSDIKIAVLSNDPEFTKSAYNVESVHRMKLGEVMGVLKNTKLLLSGGGSLIQDATSTKSLIYYLGVVCLARLCGAKVMVYANGVGPVKQKCNRRLVKYVLNKAELITLRDKDSLSELSDMGVTKPEIKVTADPALNLSISENAEDITKELFGDKTPIAVSLRRWKDCDEDLISACAKCCEYFKGLGYAPFFMPMQYSKDYEICKSSADRCGCICLPENLTTEEVAGILSKCKFVIGMRLHAVIYAAASGTVPVGIVYDPKVKGFMKYIGSENFADAKDITGEKLISVCEKACEIGSFDVSGLKKLAFSNATLAVELLKK